MFDWAPWLIDAVLLGLVEGLTEFLPISSTGHLILASSLLDFTGERANVYQIVIQSGAILAVVWHYRRRLWQTCAGVRSEPEAQRLVVNLAIAFMPLAVLGLLLHKAIKAMLFHPVPVSIALVLGGVVILWIERRHQSGKMVATVTDVSQMGYRDALAMGFMQALALIPGVSRSGATIIGGMWLGLSRQAACEFSFLLAIPTLLIASAYQMIKERDLFTWSDLPSFAVGLSVAFLSALVCIRWLLRYVANHDFQIFAWYRIVFGLVVFATAFWGIVDWRS